MNPWPHYCWIALQKQAGKLFSEKTNVGSLYMGGPVGTHSSLYLKFHSNNPAQVQFLKKFLFSFRINMAILQLMIMQNSDFIVE